MRNDVGPFGCVGRWLMWFLSVASPVSAQTERLPASVYSTGEGLAHFAINRVVRDSHGFLWFCTRDGLSQFDGSGFTTYHTADGLPTGDIRDLLETPDGNYWVATGEGLVRFDPAAPPAPRSSDLPRRARFTVVAGSDDARESSITHLARDRSGTLWVGTRAGLFRIDESGPQPRMVPMDVGIADEFNARVIQALLVDRRGAIWVAAGSGLYVRQPGGTLNRLVNGAGRPPVTVSSLLEDREGTIWAGTTGGLWRLTTSAAGAPVLTGLFNTSAGLPADWVRALLEGSDGTLWAGTVAGLARVENRSDPLKFEQVEPAGARLDIDVTALAEDENGDVWTGTATVGAVRVPRSGFRLFAGDHGPTWATAIAETTDGVAILGRRGRDMAIFCSDGRSARAVKPHPAVGELSWAWHQVLMQDSSGDWWLGTTRGVFRFRGPPSCQALYHAAPTEHFDSSRGLAADVVIRLFEDSRGDVWIATVGHGLRPDGLSRWKRRTGRLQQFTSRDGLPSFERHYVSAIGEDRAGNVWFGFSGDGGLARFRKETFTTYTKAHGVPPGQVRNLTFDPEGRLWIASFRRGLGRVDDPTADMPSLRTYTTADGLSSNESHVVVSDEAGFIYVGSAHGIDRVDPKTGAVRHYAHADGVPTGEMHAAIRDRHGTLWFTYNEGVLRFNPRRELPSRPPRVLVRHLAVDGEALPVSAIGERHVRPVRLSHERNSLQVGFIALGARQGREYVYRHRFENGPTSWSRFSAARTLNFFNLPPGEYRLWIEAADAAGRLSDEPASIRFTIMPPVWRQTWFLGLLALGVVSLAYGVHRHRISQLVEVARIRDRIAADLHDDLGANLTRIAVLGEVARRQRDRHEGALAAIAHLARESVSDMSDIVWAIDPARDTIDDLVRKMRQHATETFADEDVALEFTAPTEAHGRQLGIEFRKDVLLVFKEAINNAARHANCRRVEIDVALDDASFRFRVSDDGAGFARDAIAEGRGLSSMHRRAARMRGTLDVQSRPGEGTTVTLTLPLDRSRPLRAKPTR